MTKKLLAAGLACAAIQKTKCTWKIYSRGRFTSRRLKKHLNLVNLANEKDAKGRTDERGGEAGKGRMRRGTNCESLLYIL